MLAGLFIIYLIISSPPYPGSYMRCENQIVIHKRFHIFDF